MDSALTLWMRRLFVTLAQNLAGLSVEQMHLRAGGAHDPDIFVLGNIRVVIQLVLDVETGRRAPENEMGHQSGYDGSGMLGSLRCGRPFLSALRSNTFPHVRHSKVCSSYVRP
jgi:hypothetical protein